MAQLRYYSLYLSWTFSLLTAEEIIPFPISLTRMTYLSSSMAGIYFIPFCIAYTQLSELSIGFCKISLLTWTFTYVILFNLHNDK